MDKFIETDNLPRQNNEAIENLNKQIMSKDIKTVIKNFPTKEIPGPDSFMGQFHQIFKELMPMFLKLHQILKEHFQNSLYKASITLIQNQKRTPQNYRPKLDKQITSIVYKSCELNSQFFAEEMQITSKHMKRFSPSLEIWKIQIKILIESLFKNLPG